MKFTLSADKDLIQRARQVARQRRTTLNDLVREHLRALTRSKRAKTGADRLFALMDEALGSLRGRKWKRDDLYRRGAPSRQ